MTTNIQDHINLNCVDIVKDAINANKNQIKLSRNDLVIKGNCSDSPNLIKVKEAITNSYEKLFPILNNGSRNTKVNVNISNFFIDAGWSSKIIER